MSNPSFKDLVKERSSKNVITTEKKVEAKESERLAQARVNAELPLAEALEGVTWQGMW